MIPNDDAFSSSSEENDQVDCIVSGVGCFVTAQSNKFR